MNHTNHGTPGVGLVPCVEASPVHSVQPRGVHAGGEVKEMTKTTAKRGLQEKNSGSCGISL